MSRYERLAPCPFCGGQGEVDVLAPPQAASTASYVKCRACGCRSATFVAAIESEPTERSVAAWNRRAGPSPEALEAERDELRDMVDRLRLEAQIHAGEARTQTATVHECYQAASGATGERGSWHGAGPVRERIEALEAENKRLRVALEKIRDRDYRGNRCSCSDIARTALEETP